MLLAIDMGDPFDLVWITADRKRGTGGKIMRVEDWTKVKGSDSAETLPGQFLQSNPVIRRNPNHFLHKTFNICNPRNPGERPKKVHWRLMIFFNGKRILQ